jgi:hypothetical protein
MPERMQAQNFNRRISANEALILATAGDGSKTDDFRNLLCLYRELHNIGYRSSMDLTAFIMKANRVKFRQPKTRKPMSEERKAVLVMRLAAFRLEQLAA